MLELDIPMLEQSNLSMICFFTSVRHLPFWVEVRSVWYSWVVSAECDCLVGVSWPIPHCGCHTRDAERVHCLQWSSAMQYSAFNYMKIFKIKDRNASYFRFVTRSPYCMLQCIRSGTRGWYPRSAIVWFGSAGQYISVGATLVTRSECTLIQY